MGEKMYKSSARGMTVVVAVVVSLLLAVFAFWSAFPAAAEEDPTRDPRIVGGTSVPDGKYPFLVSIQSSRVETPSGHFCGGTLLDSDSILTAAHCADVISRRDTNSSIGFEGIRIVVGRTVLTSDQGQVRGIASFSDVKMNPRFDRRTFEYDSAVIDLDRPVSGIKPVSLPQTKQNGLEIPGRKLTISGWGNTIAQSPSDVFLGEGETNIPNRMRETKVPVVSDARANIVYSPDYNPKIMVAAGEDGKDTCQGDSGGPLFQRIDGRTLQVGITSYGFGCANGAFPGVYAEVNSPQIRAFIVKSSD